MRAKLCDPSHPFKKVIKDLGISQNIIAFNVGIPFQRFYRFLNGYCPMPPHIEEKVAELLDSIKKESTHGADA